MDDRKLIEQNVTARMMRKTLLALAILGPIPLLGMIWFIKERELAIYFVCAAVMMVSGGISGWVLFTQMLKVTRSEIEYRKFQKDKEKERNTTQQGNAS
jgi:hypothetical protein